MKIRTPRYYKDFKCIAGACTDTCCAGWDVDVDEDSYSYYKTVGGEFGKRLKSVMVPSEEGGCTFTLNEGRCPFLNNENLCDLYTELGEDKLCDTCAEFPRFINEYGSLREIGIAPSCITAGEIIFNYKDKLTFDMEENNQFITSYNDIDPLTYKELTHARNAAYSLVQDRTRTINERCILLLEYAYKIQKKLDAEQDHLISGVVKAFAQKDYCDKIVEKRLKSHAGISTAYDNVCRYFETFKGMEVINPDWNDCLKVQKEFMEYCRSNGGEDEYVSAYNKFDIYYQDRMFEYEQLLSYYVYRYFLDAVYDYNVLLKVKNGIVGYLCLKQLDVAKWHMNGHVLSKAEQIDMAHLYSRQFEHSYSNFETYSEFFEKRRIYSRERLIRILMDTL